MSIHISDAVIATIASTAVLEAEGVAGMSGNFAGEIAGKPSRKKYTKGVCLKVEGETVQVSVGIVVQGGAKIQKVAQDVQQRVKNAIETMTGFTISEVNVQVTGMSA